MPWFKIPSALEVAIKDLEEASRERLVATKAKEYYMAMEKMHIARIRRLKQDIKQLTQKEEHEEDSSGGGCDDRSEPARVSLSPLPGGSLADLGRTPH